MRRVLSDSGADTSYSLSVPAPIGGWNAADPVASMKAIYATQLDNLFPTEVDVRLRPGYTKFVDLSWQANDIIALLVYKATDGQSTLFAVTSKGYYEVTSDGLGSFVLFTVTSTDVMAVNITTAGGSFLFTCGGGSYPKVFDGTSWKPLLSGSTPPLTGIDPYKVVYASLFKSRLYLLAEDSLSFWFLPVNSFAGAASEFPLGAVCRRGGYLVATESWTVDGGSGIDDYFVAITSEGEVIVYQGYDPSSAANWALVGVFILAKPVSRRCFVRFGGDLLVFTEAGIYPISKALQSSTVDKDSSVAQKIEPVLKEYYLQFNDLPGWEACLFPAAPLLLLNIPTSLDTSYQCVMNTMTGAWARFTGINARCWALVDNELFFAKGKKVYKAWTGLSDAGAVIRAQARTAFQYLGTRGKGKRVTLLRPSFTLDKPVNYRISLLTDFNISVQHETLATAAISADLWDGTLWDEAIWSGPATAARWQTVSHLAGRAFSVGLSLVVEGVNLRWNSTDLIAESGGLL